MTDNSAYQTMKDCIEKCPGVAPDAAATQAVDNGQANSIPVAVVTLAPSVVLTAYETAVTTGSSSQLEAVIGSQTLTLGSAVQTVSSAPLSLASSGLVVGTTSTVPFTAPSATISGTSASVQSNTTPTGSASDLEGDYASVLLVVVLAMVM